MAISGRTSFQINPSICSAITLAEKRSIQRHSPHPPALNRELNALRGFGAWQQDLAIRRAFKLSEKISLQFRAEAFNLFNHPNFSPPANNISSAFFGQSIEMLNHGLGGGGLAGGSSPLYQIGGPRSGSSH